MTVADVALVAPSYGEEEGETELAAILDRLDAALGNYVAFPSAEARRTVAAWTVHTHAIDAFESTPRLALLSPEKGSGKTRTLEVLDLLVPGPLHTVNLSAAALFRKVADGRCTLLLDEADTYLGIRVAQQHEELRGLVNAGHRRGAVAYRCVIEKGVQVQEFPAFAAVAIAGIGDLPDTILDRSVVIGMKRRSPTELVLPFRRRRAEHELAGLRAHLEQWAQRNVSQLAHLEPDMPEGITDRPADVWEPLVAIGDAAGPRWSALLREAAVVLNQIRSERDPSLGVRLLADCRAVFAGHERLTTQQLIEGLRAIEESPWDDLRGEPLNARGLAYRLRPYEIRPGNHRFGESTKKGYLRADFHDTWTRYLQPVTPVSFQEGDVGQALDHIENQHPAGNLQQGQQGQQEDGLW